MRVLIAILLLTSVAHGKHPYDSVCRVEAGGSGVMLFVEGGKGLVVTNAHVMPNKAETECYWPAVKARRKALVVGYHGNVDLCFMVVDDPPVPFVKTGIRDSHVIFTGFPHYDREHLHWQYGNFKRETLVQTYWENKPVPGMSGGAVFDRKDGDLCGITEAADDPNVGVGISDLALFMTSLQYKDPKTWVPDGSHVASYEPGEWTYAKPSKYVRTKVYRPERAPHWEVKPEPKPAPDYQLLELSRRSP